MSDKKGNLKHSHLKHARMVKGWSQKEVADKIGTTHVNVSRWERGVSTPYPYFRQKLCDLFMMDSFQLGFVEEHTEFIVSTADPIVLSAQHPNDGQKIFDPAIPIPTQKEGIGVIGRTQLLADLKRQLLLNTSVALNGLPGVGKTTLALALAYDREIQEHFHDGILWASLGLQNTVDDILSRWGALCGISATGIGTHTKESWTAILREVIGNRRMLIIIDDAWDITPSMALKIGGPECSYILTTRFPLVAASFSPRKATKVTELNEEDSVFFLRQFVDEDPHNEKALLELVHILGGLPLALTLVGKYLHVQSYNGQPRRFHLALQQLRQAEHRLYVSDVRPPADTYSNLLAPGTRLSLQTVIAMSDNHLIEPARRALRALSVFPPKPNTFSEEAALAVAESIEVIDALSDAGLLEFDGGGRYTMHQAISDYACTVSSIDRLDDVVQHYVAFFAGYIKEYATNTDELNNESQNIFKAMELAYRLEDHRVFIRSIYTLMPFFLRRGLYDAALVHLERSRKFLEIMDDKKSTSICLHYLGMVSQKKCEYEQATHYYQDGLYLARQINDTEQICILLSDLGWVSAKRGMDKIAKNYAQEGLRLAERINNDASVCRLYTVLGWMADNEGLYTVAENHYQKGLNVARRINDTEQMCILLIDLGVNASVRGNPKKSIQLNQVCLEMAKQLGHLEWQCLICSNMVADYTRLQEYEIANDLVTNGLRLAKQLGNREWLAQMLQNQAVLFVEWGKESQAEQLLKDTLVLSRQIGKPDEICEVLRYLGWIALAHQEPDIAFAYFSEMLSIVPEGHQVIKGATLFFLAQVAAMKGEEEEMQRFVHESLSVFDEIEHWAAGKVRLWVDEGCLPTVQISINWCA